MDRLSTFARVRTQTTLTPYGLTSNARFCVRFSIALNAADGGRAWHVWPRGAARHHDDDASVLLDHLARGGASGDEPRPDHRVERHHERFNRQIDGELTVAVLFGQRPGKINEDVDLSGLARDAVDVVVHGRVVNAVDDGGVDAAAIRRNVLRDGLHTSLRAAGQKTWAPSAANSFATAAPIVPAAPKTTACFPFRTGTPFI